MLGVRHTGRVAWRRKHASRHYLGYVLVTDDAIRLAGDENETGIHAVLSIPPTAIEGLASDACRASRSSVSRPSSSNSPTTTRSTFARSGRPPSGSTTSPGS